jgi:hypothetical protein
MKVYCRSTRAASIFHDGVLVQNPTTPTPKLKAVARCARHTWREGADWQVGAGTMTVNCQHCLRLRRLEGPA